MLEMLQTMKENMNNVLLQQQLRLKLLKSVNLHFNWNFPGKFLLLRSDFHSFQFGSCVAWKMRSELECLP